MKTTNIERLTAFYAAIITEQKTEVVEQAPEEGGPAQWCVSVRGADGLNLAYGMGLSPEEAAGKILEHVEEFGECIGTVIDLLDYNNVPKTHPDHNPALIGPEWNVRWQPSNLRYAYVAEELDILP